MSNPSPEVKAFLEWVGTIPEDQLPLCWEISGKDRQGVAFSIGERYPSKEAAEAAISTISRWADPANLEIREVWDMEKSALEWEELRKK